MDFTYFKNIFKLIAADLSEQKVLDPDSRPIQQIIFIGKTSQAAVIYYIYEKSKETVLPLSKGTPSFVTTYKWLNTEKQMLNYQILNWKNSKLLPKKEEEQLREYLSECLKMLNGNDLSHEL